MPSGLSIRLLLTSAALLTACSNRDPLSPDRLYDSSAALFIASRAGPDGQVQADPLEPLRPFGEALKAQGFALETVSSPTVGQARAVLQRWGGDHGQGLHNRLVVVVRAPGLTRLTRAGRPSGVLAMSDTPAGEAIRGPGEVNALTVEALDEWAKSLPARHVLLVLDACFNGSVFHGQGDLPDRRSDTPAAPVVHYIVAGDAPSCVRGQGSPLLLSLVQALRSSATDLDGDGLISATEVGIRAQRDVADQTEGLQTPRSGKSADRYFAQGEFLFRRPQPGVLPADRGQP